jgi:hypothetical protein
VLKFPLIVKLTGVSFGNAQENIKTFGCPDIQWFGLYREPNNAHDPNAIRVALLGDFFLGYIPQNVASELAPMIDAGRQFDAEYVCVNKHPRHDIVGLTVKIIEVGPTASEKTIYQKGGVQNDA